MNLWLEPALLIVVAAAAVAAVPLLVALVRLRRSHRLGAVVCVALLACVVTVVLAMSYLLYEAGGWLLRAFSIAVLSLAPVPVLPLVRRLRDHVRAAADDRATS